MPLNFGEMGFWVHKSEFMQYFLVSFPCNYYNSFWVITQANEKLEVNSSSVNVSCTHLVGITSCTYQW